MAAEQEAEQSIKNTKNEVTAKLAATRTEQQQILAAERSNLESDLQTAVTTQLNINKELTEKIVGKFDAQANAVVQSFHSHREKLLALIKQQI